MKISPWERRIERAQELCAQYDFAAEILGFYIHVARFQEGLNRELSGVLQSSGASLDCELGASELAELASTRFEAFLLLAEAEGPEQLRKLSRELRERGGNSWSELLRDTWAARNVSNAEALLAVAFLQPYAELLRSRASFGHTKQSRSNQIRGRGKQAYALCPFCGRRPGLGVLRQMGEGGARSLVCSFCLAEWEFRRVVCSGCGEENYQRLAVFTAAEFDYIRVESCEGCKTYIKTVDLTKNGRAEPVVDELASAPLDLWARERGFAKLQCNVLGL